MAFGPEGNTRPMVARGLVEARARVLPSSRLPDSRDEPDGS